jgi:Zn-dependent M28 family amino/carboxypeptidase
LVLQASRGAHGTLFVRRGGSYRVDAEPALPSMVVAVEHYGQMVRLLKKEVPVKLEVNVQARFLDEVDEHNVLAELPGTDPQLRDELVMLGGHLDSWHSASGATDNAAGCAVAMEAVRILKAIEVKPRRTIRIALWSGEEQGLLGSRAYVKKHFADRETMELTAEHDNVSAYFNLDNGTGRIRGIYCQGNDAVRPIFEAYLKPFHDLEATTVTNRTTGDTDHLAFDAVGLPGFQFIQDRIDYSTRTHHTNMDTYERLQRGDLMQASVIMASFVYHTAMRDQKLPRKALPKPRKPRD